MKTKAISSIFLLFTLVAGIISMSPASFADHSEITITPVPGSGFPDSGCEVDGCYSPSTATVDVGGVVIFSNTDSVSHTFSSGVPSDDIIGILNSIQAILAPGDSAEWIPEDIGEFAYFDMVHPWMQGTIIVQEAGEETHSEGNSCTMVEETVVEETVVEETMVEETVVEETVVEETVVEETVVEETVVEETVVEETVVEETVVAPTKCSMKKKKAAVV